MDLLEIKDLHISFWQDGLDQEVIRGIDFNIPENSIVGIVGESGSGKTVTAMSIIQLLGRNPPSVTGKILWNESGHQIDLLRLNEEQIRPYRGAKISVIFQEPMTSLNPVLTCGFQASEGLRVHKLVPREAIKAEVLKGFQKVGLQDPERVYDAYPFELSGGQLQRVLIALSILCKPKLIIADEPTTALDASLQKHILLLLKQLKAELGVSILFISHDLGMVRELCDYTLVMHKGLIVEKGPTKQLFDSPVHAYTKGLLYSRPPLRIKLRRLPTLKQFLEPHSAKLESQMPIPVEEQQLRRSLLDKAPELLTIRDLRVDYKKKAALGFTHSMFSAVKQVSFSIKQGEILGLVGESGSGKSSIGKAILNLVEPSSGSVRYSGKELTSMSPLEWRSIRKSLQIIFQDPYSALNPRQTVGSSILEPMQVHKLHGGEARRKDRVFELLELVGLQKEHYDRFPHQFSGGQRQRICIARALSLEPKFIVCDEAVSALDVSIQAQILNLLLDLRDRLSLSFLFITHDLAVVHFIADRIAVLKEGEIVEIGAGEDVILNPQHAYTRALIDAVSPD